MSTVFLTNKIKKKLCIYLTKMFKNSPYNSVLECGATESKKNKYILFEVKKYGDYEF